MTNQGVDYPIPTEVILMIVKNWHQTTKSVEFGFFTGFGWKFVKHILKKGGTNEDIQAARALRMVSSRFANAYDPMYIHAKIGGPLFQKQYNSLIERSDYLSAEYLLPVLAKKQLDSVMKEYECPDDNLDFINHFTEPENIIDVFDRNIMSTFVLVRKVPVWKKYIDSHWFGGGIGRFYFGMGFYNDPHMWDNNIPVHDGIHEEVGIVHSIPSGHISLAKQKKEKIKAAINSRPKVKRDKHKYPSKQPKVKWNTRKQGYRMKYR